MNISDPNNSSPAESQEVPGSTGDPYRTPAEVHGAAKKGLIKSPIAWICFAAVLAAGYAVFGFLGSRHVEEFGFDRAGPPIEEAYEQADSVADEAYGAAIISDPIP
jgi:hypothetical protein